MNLSAMFGFLKIRILAVDTNLGKITKTSKKYPNKVKNTIEFLLFSWCHDAH